MRRDLIVMAADITEFAASNGTLRTVRCAAGPNTARVLYQHPERVGEMSRSYNGIALILQSFCGACQVSNAAHTLPKFAPQSRNSSTKVSQPESCLIGTRVVIVRCTFG
jgi:hypothetical protein